MGITEKLKEMLSHRARSTQYLAEIAAGGNNQQRLINDKLIEVIVTLRDLSNALSSKLDALVAGSNNQQRLLNVKLEAVIAGLNDQTRQINEKLDAIIAKKD
jgi:hypothetical protein